MFKIAIASDHRGYHHKAIIQLGVTIDISPIEWIDFGCFSPERTDYPPFAIDVAKAVQSGNAQYGILLCGSGIGMAVTANRFDKIYAAIVWNELSAQRAKEEDNTNILSLPADFITPQESIAIIMVWLNAEFKAGRYQKRIEMIDALGRL